MNGTVGDQNGSIDASAREATDENTPRALNEPLAPSSDLCEELVRISSDHRRVIELLTRAQFPSALSPTDYDDSSIALQPASSVQFECDAGKTLDEPRNIVDVFLFGGGEVDTLEIRLYELHPVVDKFIAVTSNVTHKGEAILTRLSHCYRRRGLNRFATRWRFSNTHKPAPRRRTGSISNSKQRKRAP